MVSDDQTLWSDANALLRTYGKGALQHVSDQISAFMHQGNDVEMLRWFEIHERIQEVLTEAPAWPTD